MRDTRDNAILDAHHFLRDEQPGLRRVLRRIEERANALYQEGTHVALRHLSQAGFTDLNRALDALLLLSHVEKHVSGRLGRQFRATVRPERFRRLVTDDRDEALEQLRRMVQQCKGYVDVVDLARIAYWWGIPAPVGSTIRPAKDRLALDYYTSNETEEDTE